MRATFNPAQADLFGARDLHLSAMPVPETEEVSRLQSQVRHLRGELQAMVDTLRLVNDSLAKERARVASYQAEVRELTAEVRRLRRRPVSSGSCAMPKPTWRLLMQLVHPDKHDGSAASLAAAKWLNENKPE